MPSKKVNGEWRYEVPHVDKRHGEGWPKPASSGIHGTWTGWLTHKEYDAIDLHLKVGIRNINYFATTGWPKNSCERIFRFMKASGVLEGNPSDFKITERAKELFRLTDLFILSLELDKEVEEEDENVA